MKPFQLKALNRQLSLLSGYKRTCDFAVQRSDSLIADYEKNTATFKELIINKDLEIQNNQTEIKNLNVIAKKQRKKWIKNAFYFSGGALGVGLITGILIAK